MSVKIVLNELEKKLKNGKTIALLFDLDGTLYVPKTLKQESFKSLAWVLADKMKNKKDWLEDIEIARNKAEEMVNSKRIELKNFGKSAQPSDVRDALGMTAND